MTLQQEAQLAVQLLPEDKLPVLIEFARFLNRRGANGVPGEAHELLAGRRSLSGILKGKVHMADDFNETPDVFKEYL